MKKKILAAVILSALAVSAFSGCGNTDSTSTTESETAETSAAEETSEETDSESAEETEAETEEETSEEDSGFGVWTEIAGENGTEYSNLFSVILSDDDYSYWYDYSAAVVGEDNAADTAGYLRSFISADIYGADAVAAYADTDGFTFDCWFINDAETFYFEGDKATVNKTDGTSETHTYEYLGVYQIGANEIMNYQGMEFCPAFDCDVYKSTDDAGEFTYFLFRDDTMATTYHTEFRYGSDLEELQKYLEGDYAYWLSAGIDSTADEETIEKVIALFCLENMDYSTRTDSSVSQIADFVGTWNADLSSWGDEYKDTVLYTVIDENGHGETYMDGEKTADYSAYAYDNGTKGDGEGLYVAYSNIDFEAEEADYVFTTNDDGQTVLTFVKDGSEISYIKADAE